MSAIIDKYKLVFQILKGNKNVRLASIDSENNPDLGFHLWGYFRGLPINFLTNYLLPEVNNAINGHPFQEDGDGTLSFLTIGPSVSTFSALNEAVTDVSIPTQDLKDIIDAWVGWITINHLEGNI